MQKSNYISGMNSPKKVKVGIVGLGWSKPAERPDCDYVIGVNDAPNYCDRIVVVDNPSVFDEYRLYQINIHPALLWSNVYDWAMLRPCFNFKLHPVRGNMQCILNGEIPQSITSIIPAIGTAYATFGKTAQYKLYGVDLLGHQSLSDKEKVQMISKHLFDLGKLIDLSFGSLHKDSPLSQVLPNYP